jgi:hypothetical protein
MLMFYICRALCQLLFKLQYPPGYLWPFPGISSIVVPYGATSDFFFSGHVGFLLICALEFRNVQLRKMYAITMLINMYMIFVMLVFRVHYSFDITTGLFFAHYSFITVNKNLESLDRFWLNLYIETIVLCTRNSKNKDHNNSANIKYITGSTNPMVELPETA